MLDVDVVLHHPAKLVVGDPHQPIRVEHDDQLPHRLDVLRLKTTILQGDLKNRDTQGQGVPRHTRCVTSDFQIRSSQKGRL